MNDGTPSERELDGYRTGADRFIAELDEEYYLHYAGLKPEFELRPIYERHADLTDLNTIRRIGTAVDGKGESRALPLRLRRLPRRAHARARGEDRGERDEARDPARGRGGRVPDAAADDRQHGRSRHAGTPRGGAERPHRGAPEPALPRRRPHDAARDARPGRADLLPPLPRPLRVRPRGPRGSVPGVSRLDRAAVRGLDGPRPPGTRRDRPRRGGALGRPPLLPRLRLGRCLPRRPDAARAARHALRPRDRSRLAGQRPSRRRGAPDEEPARVLRPDRDPGQGDARDPAAGRAGRLVRALPRSRVIPSTSPSPTRT